MKHRFPMNAPRPPLRLAVGAVSVLLVIAGVGSAILVHAASAGPPPAGPSADPAVVASTAPTAAPANPSSCAGQPGTLLAAPNLGPQFTVAGSVSAVRPVGSSVAFPPAPKGSAARPEPVLDPQMVWFRAETLSNPAAPHSAPLDPTSMATTDPAAIFTVTDTVQSFTSAEAATDFLRGFALTGVPLAEVRTSSGQLMSVPLTVLSGFTAGDQTLVSEQSLPQASIPATLQVVVRVGGTVITVAATGGVDLAASAVEALATQQLEQLATACGRGY